jgi:hypothetical protein
MTSARTATLLAIALATGACSSDKKDRPGATGGGPEVFLAADRQSMQGFRQGQLAVGGGHVYWVHQPRVDQRGLGQSVVKRQPVSGGEVEIVSEPDNIHGLAADGESVYWAGSRAVFSRPHGDGTPTSLASGLWLEIVPGQSYVLVRSSQKVALVPKTGGPAEVVWQGKRGRHTAAADGDRFLAIDTSERGASQLVAFSPGADPEILHLGPEATGHLGVHDGQVYFSGGGRPATLWRLNLERRGPPEPVGPRGRGFGPFLVHRGYTLGDLVSRLPTFRA